MSVPCVKSVKVFAIIESVLEPPVDLEELRSFLKQQKFRGEVHWNANQGGTTNIVTRERVPLTMSELDMVLKCR